METLATSTCVVCLTADGRRHRARKRTEGTHRRSGGVRLVRCVLLGGWRSDEVLDDVEEEVDAEGPEEESEDRAKQDLEDAAREEEEVRVRCTVTGVWWCDVCVRASDGVSVRRARAPFIVVPQFNTVSDASAPCLCRQPRPLWK